MIQKLVAILIVSLFVTQMKSQELPYREIPDYPKDYSPGNIAARMIDGLGFRYYWATEGLTKKDLNYVPSDNARSVIQILQHICSMSQSIVNAPLQKPNTGTVDYSELSFEELRELTLKNLKEASTLVGGKQTEDFEDYVIIFQRGERESRYPYWNLINGMISDCIYHTGQITLLRRVTGNPINPNVSVFLGTVRDN